MSETRSEPSLHVAPEPGDRFDEPPEYHNQYDQWPETRARRHRRRVGWLIALVVVCAGVALWSLLWQQRTVSKIAAVAPGPAAPAPAQTSQPRYPIESAMTSLPPLDASDAAMLAALQTLVSGGGLASYIEPRNLIRNFVVTVDNVPRQTLRPEQMPVKAARGSFGTAVSGNGLVIGESNSLRYAPYVKLLQGVNAEALVTLYARHYPLFQQAYHELGYPKGHFNDRLVEAIDVMLATPETSAPLKVVQPKIFYEFADRDLEQLPAGQKLVLRLGRDNAAIVKKRLGEIRALITAQSPAGNFDVNAGAARKN